MSRIFWDTPLFIYLFEAHPDFLPATKALRERMLERGDELITSTMTLGEVQVAPRRLGDVAAAERLRDVILHVSIVVPFDGKAADIFAKLRVNSSLRPPDAIQLSCAAAAGVEIFVTNDHKLQRLKVPGIHFIASLDRLPL